jgi:DNA-binding response OmpR family regulator
MPDIKILYVEDELFLGKIVKESLESRGFEVRMESDGARVLESFREMRPDVCVLDIMLPNKDGFEIAEEIRRLDERVPILFVTARTRTEDLVKGFGLGGNDYIRKPFSMEELIVRIYNTFRNHQDPSSTHGDVVPIGKYEFQVKRQVLKLGEEERKLSFREAELLRFLFENRDIVIDRKDILNLLWGNDSFFNSRNLDVYITKLRSYLRGDEALEILTIKGIGYRFITPLTFRGRGATPPR